MITFTDVISVLLVGLGVAMLVLAIANGGGPLATGVVFGLLFCLAGAGRLWAARKERRS